MPLKVKLNDNLEKYSRRIKKNANRRLFQLAQEIASIAQQLAPVDTGHLRLSISVVETVRSGIFRIVVTTADDKHPEYAAYIEWGWRNSPASPFLTPAYLAVKKRLDRYLKNLL
jgi:HK97 gp10 family phage protein